MFVSIRQNELGTHVLDDTPDLSKIVGAALIEREHVPIPAGGTGRMPLGRAARSWTY
jgi:hypothetical protein